MRRAQVLAILALALATPALGGCGSRAERSAADHGLAFEALPDTARLVAGPSLLREFEPYRASDGAMRVRGRAALPDGARLQIAVWRPGAPIPLYTLRVEVRAGGFDSEPIFDRGRAPAPGDYRFEVTAQFNAFWQPDHVLAATRNGLDLQGPGMRRGLHGEAVFLVNQEKRL